MIVVETWGLKQPNEVVKRAVWRMSFRKGSPKITKVSWPNTSVSEVPTRISLPSPLTVYCVPLPSGILPWKAPALSCVSKAERKVAFV